MSFHVAPHWSASSVILPRERRQLQTRRGPDSQGREFGDCGAEGHQGEGGLPNRRPPDHALAVPGDRNTSDGSAAAERDPAPPGARWLSLSDAVLLGPRQHPTLSN